MNDTPNLSWIIAAHEAGALDPDPFYEEQEQ